MTTTIYREDRHHQHLKCQELLQVPRSHQPQSRPSPNPTFPSNPSGPDPLTGLGGVDGTAEVVTSTEKADIISISSAKTFSKSHVPSTPSGPDPLTGLDRVDGTAEVVTTTEKIDTINIFKCQDLLSSPTVPSTPSSPTSPSTPSSFTFPSTPSPTRSTQPRG